MRESNSQHAKTIYITSTKCQNFSLCFSSEKCRRASHLKSENIFAQIFSRNIDANDSFRIVNSAWCEKRNNEILIPIIESGLDANVCLRIFLLRARELTHAKHVEFCRKWLELQLRKATGQTSSCSHDACFLRANEVILWGTRYTPDS